MEKIKNTMRISYFNIKTLPKNIIVFSVIYAFLIIFSINVLHSLNFSPIDIGEFLLTPLGILLFTHLPGFEEENNIYEFTYLKNIPHHIVVLSRIISYALGMYLLMIGVFGLERAFGAEFNFIEIVNGSFITAFYLGAIGMIAAYVSKQRTVGYIVPFIYYMLDMFTFGKYTKRFYLFSLVNQDFSIKINLLVTSIVLLIGFIIYLYRKL
ncbi:hypothetical protein SH1V18_47170 [Vallitalea longa]|uniref:Uncharacterized protein n=1 Tax=Vallitalea longa TaxID=2936439 RepID=A0A9W6DI43_9FIRM|nr:hypothetical protein [Vallitalea longa]GKX32237.1 hypothetical protein SH1V18_47170 [Vallitalea longa]